MADAPLQTPLFGLHQELGGRMVPFAGYAMPVQYASGILKEHRHTREAASLFDVSHMGQVELVGEGAAEALERLVPADVVNLEPGRARYALFTTDRGGVLDDLIVTRTDAGLYLVINASRKAEDLAHLRAHLPAHVELRPRDDLALLAVQGPKAVDVVAGLVPEAADLAFMQSLETTIAGEPARVSRLGYTGEDGFEISFPSSRAAKLANTLLAHEALEPAGLGARDSLRLEAGLCLYGHELDETTSPVEAGLVWSIQKRRREEGGFLGEERILRELQDGPARKLVGLVPQGQAPARQGAKLFDGSGDEAGEVTSGGFGPTFGGPIALAYVRADLAEPGTNVTIKLRGRDVAAEVIKPPFVPQRYFRKPKSPQPPAADRPGAKP